MSETRQSLIKVYAREDGKIVFVYGSGDTSDIESLELECVVIDREDISEVAQALFNIE